ncbi:MAG: nucleoside recognition protein [Anaerolineales bacterium]
MIVNQNGFLYKVLQEGKTIFLEAIKASVDLYKVMIPFLILTRLLEQIGVIDKLGSLLGPIMGIMGLPGNMGLVWATCLVLGTYSALLVLITLIGSTPLTIAQTTVLLTICLIAHSLPVEVMIARKAGLRIGFQLVLRVGGAVFYGILLNMFYRQSNLLQESVKILAPIVVPDPSLLGWVNSQIRNLFLIFLIILGVMGLLRMLDIVGITSLISKLIGPILRLIGIGEIAIPVTMVGILLGLSYGSGLILNAAKSGKIPPYDMFFSLALMCIFHSLIEDTITMFVFGADLSGLLWGRLIFTFITLFLMVRLLRQMPHTIFQRYLFATSY